MNICFFSIVTYWHGLKGGMDLHGKNLWEGLVRKGNRVTVITTRHPSGKSSERINGVNFQYLKNTTYGSPRKGWKRESRRKFHELLLKDRFDIAAGQSWAAAGIARTAGKTGVPTVSVMHGYEMMIFFSMMNQVFHFRKGYSTLPKAFLSSLYYALCHEFPSLRRSSRVIAVSEKVGEKLARWPLVNRESVQVIYPGIDLECFKPCESERKKVRSKLGIEEKDRAILFLSIVSRQKGADIALKALRLLRHEENALLIIAGDGDYLNEAKALAAKLGISSQVRFTGFVANYDTPGYYNAADIFVFPTLRLESFGIVLAEAMACGKPVIASKIGSIPNVIDHGKNGILVPPGEPNALAKAISVLLHDREFSERLSRNARQKALERFCLETMIDKTIKVFESLISRT